MKKISLLVLIALTAQITFAQEANLKKLDSLFKLIEENEKGMGSVSIFKEGKEIYQKTIGYASLSEKKKADAQTQYRIGSISKTFTAVLIMQLVEEGKLNLDTKLEKFFPQIPNAEKISIEQLLRHESGLFNFTASPDYLRWMVDPKSKEELLNIIVNNSTVFQPGEKNEYSNTNYVLLSFIVEELTGKPYGDILQSKIVKPAKLTGTHYGTKINLNNNEAYSYDKLGNWILSTETDPSIPIGAGGIVSTSTDINRFFNRLFADGLVSDSSLTKMRTLKGGYGLGLFEIPFYQKKGLGHSGGIDGFKSMSVYFPDDKIAVTYLGNAVDMPVNDILLGILSCVYGMDYQLPSFKDALTLSSEELEQYLGVYTSPGFPLKVTISKKGNTLMGQATGQPAFPLSPVELHKFSFDKAQLSIEFLPAEKKLILLQGGGKFELTRE